MPFFWRILTSLRLLILAAAAPAFDPLFDICSDGVPDVVFTLPTGQNMLFKGRHYFEIDDSRAKASAPFEINDKWRQLPLDVDLAFTLMDTMWGEARNRTVFVKADRYFVFDDQLTLVTSGSTEYWFQKKGSKPTRIFYDQVIYQKSDAIVSFRRRKMANKHEWAMLFDDVVRPELVKAFRLDAVFHSSVASKLQSSQAVYFVPSVGDTFHLYFQAGDEGFVCFLSRVDSPVTSRASFPSSRPLTLLLHFS